MSNSISDIENSKCLLVFGYNCADSHPIVARRVIKARENGAKIIVCDPRRIETARIADRHLQLNNGSNMALVNAFGYVLLEEELYNKAYVERYTEGLDAYREAVKDYAPEAVEGIVGVSAREIREAMRMFAAAPSATIMWGMGVTQFGGRWTWCAVWQAALLTGSFGAGERRRGAGPRAKQRAGRLRYGRAAEPVPGLSGGHRPRRAGEIRRRTGCRPGADG